jgi:hypothetical protein
MGSTKQKIVIGISVAVTILSVVALFWLIEDRISPETVRRQIVQKLRAFAPHATVEMGKISLRPGARLAYTIDGFSLFTTIQQKPFQLLKVKQARVEVSLWSILVKQGRYKVHLDHPEVKIVSIGNSSNWGHSLHRDINQKIKEVDQAIDALQSVSTTITGSRIDLDARDLHISYRLPDAGEGKINISKLLIKKVNLDHPSAMELISDNKITLPNNQILKCKTVFIGDFNLRDLISREELALSGVLIWREFQPEGVKVPVKRANSNLKMVITSSGSIRGNLNGSIVTGGKYSFDYLWAKSKLSLVNFNGEIPLGNLAEFIAGKRMAFIPSELKLSGQGKVDFVKAGIKSDMELKVFPAISTTHLGLPLTSKIDGRLSGDGIDLAVVSHALKGVINTKTRLRWEELLGHKRSTPLKVRVTASNMIVDSSSKFFFDMKKGVGSKKGHYLTSSSPLGAEIPLALDVKIENLQLDKRRLDGQLSLTVFEQKMLLKPFEFRSENSIMRGWFKAINGDELGRSSDFHLGLSNFDISLLKSILPIDWKEITGIVSGDISGDWQTKDKMGKHSYRVESNIAALNGVIPRVNLGKVAKDHFSTLISPASKDDKQDKGGKGNPSGAYAKITLKMKATPELVKIMNITFLDDKRLLSVKGGGQIYPLSTEHPGQLDFKLRDDTGILLQDIGRKYTKGKGLLVRFIGFGYDLKPDLKYITLHLSKMISNYHKKVK